MTGTFLALALCGGFPSGDECGTNRCDTYGDKCAMCGCHAFWHVSVRGHCNDGKEACFGSWFLNPRFGSNCNDRFYLTPAPHQGYYYFQPYNYRHLVQHSQDGAAMGEDPQTPYANELFRRRYRQKPEAAPDNNANPETTPMEPRPLRPKTDATVNPDAAKGTLGPIQF